MVFGTISTRGRSARLVALVAGGSLLMGACGGGGGGGASGDYCDIVRSYVAQAEILDDFGGEDATPGDLRAGMNQLRQELQRLERAAPGEIRDDVRMITSSLRELIEALERVDFNFFALFGDARAMETFERLEASDMLAAQRRVDEFTQARCGVSFDFGGGAEEDFDFDFDFEGLEDFNFEDLDFGFDGEDGMGDNIFDSGENPFSDEFFVDMMVPIYMSTLGITEDQARCLAGSIFSATDGSAEADFFTACGIDPSAIGG